MGGVNFLVGPDAGGTVWDDMSDGGTVVITPDGHAAVVRGDRDGTEFSVAAIVLVALLFLILLRMGGFQTVIAASISSAR